MTTSVLSCPFVRPCRLQGGSGDPVCADAIDSWYSEVSNYRFTATPIEDNDFKWVI